MKETIDLDSNSLIDCYRIALDFGMPAALKAMEHLKNNDDTEYLDTLLLPKETKPPL